ncbi:hypothetical protein PV783_13680 [Chitinophaga sp. CC14]|uniref:hypothetical protein n=1 Tax=Chitinophaga sp. CC14 TaxID=3029199 RepID=UPI003B77734F
MKSFLSLLTMTILFYPIFAQTSYRPGYLISSCSDTIRGLVWFDPQGPNIGGLRFKVTMADKPRSVSLSDILGFGLVNGDTYIRKAVAVEEGGFCEDNSSPPAQGSTITVFLKVLIRGDMLNFFSLKESQRFFISDWRSPGLLRELTAPHSQDVFGSYGSTALDPASDLATNGEKRGYRELLMEYVSPFDSFRHNVEHVPFLEDSLRWVIAHLNTPAHTRYNSCAVAGVKPGLFSFYIGAGLQSNWSTLWLSTTSVIKYRPVFNPCLDATVEIGNGLAGWPVVGKVGAGISFSSLSYSGNIGPTLTLKNYDFTYTIISGRLGLLVPYRQRPDWELLPGVEIAYERSFIKSGRMEKIESGVSSYEGGQNKNIQRGTFALSTQLIVQHRKIGIGCFWTFYKQADELFDGFQMHSHRVGLNFIYRIK